jgi:hypothetical protein
LTFGLLHSRFHRAWALRKGSDLEDRPRYTHTTTFATYPFPDGMTPDIPAEVARRLPAVAAIEAAAQRLDGLRQGWLYPADLVRKVPEVVQGFPARILGKNEAADHELGRRTLTNLYNDQPEWLTEAHRLLDEAVALAYGWPVDISEEDALARLFELNQERAPLTQVV